MQYKSRIVKDILLLKTEMAEAGGGGLCRWNHIIGGKGRNIEGCRLEEIVKMESEMRRYLRVMNNMKSKEEKK